ncbi:MAG: hypothetical protein ACLFTI_04990 [Anaerolineales bacterium]
MKCSKVTDTCFALRDPEARFIHYTGRNQDGEQDAKPARTVQPANTDERVIFPADFSHLRQRLPQLPISELVADAALGYTAYLELIYYLRH